MLLHNLLSLMGFAKGVTSKVPANFSRNFWKLVYFQIQGFLGCWLNFEVEVCSERQESCCFWCLRCGFKHPIPQLLFMLADIDCFYIQGFTCYCCKKLVCKVWGEGEG